eukprot:7756347-Pyramimonas_sp.AAC.1
MSSTAVASLSLCSLLRCGLLIVRGRVDNRASLGGPRWPRGPARCKHCLGRLELREEGGGSILTMIIGNIGILNPTRAHSLAG